jgi:alpha-glucosidase (family GH31 glycosyl hydrolase)
MSDNRGFEGVLSEDTKTSIVFLSDNVIRIRVAPVGGEFGETGLNRYGFIEETLSEVNIETSESESGFTVESAKLAVKCDSGTGAIEVLDCDSGATLLCQESCDFRGKIAEVKCAAEPNDDWIGFGDQTRERLHHRGHTVDLSIRNVESYIPIPFFMSNVNNYAVLVNSTHRVVFDMCASDENTFSWRDTGGRIDYYVIAGDGYRSLINDYTALTGRPKLPPIWAFGLWYVCRTQANDFEAVSDAMNFRREEIPCDVIGLEPGWMETNYDLSVDKEWSKERFPIPSYCQNGPHNFINAIKRMGFKMELWLCQEYDLLYEEERRLGANTANDDGNERGDAKFHETAEIDEHFSLPRYSDQITKIDEPWFDHLKKFVDQGVDFFKQDGAFHVCDHPDRLWGGTMTDAEMHNLYPLFYCRQMHEGFVEHTGRRPVVFTPDGWTGFQAWCGTWTGDTGGGIDTLGAMLNTSAVGHSWSTNDMEVASMEGLHFGYLQPWSQINSWNYFRMPWIQGDELSAAHKFYANLRARLVPYIYSWGRYATLTGWPVMTPLTMEFPDDTECAENLHQYLLGRDLMVGIFKNDIYFPNGRWKDFWSGEIIDGGCERTVDWPKGRGGSLYLREGAIVPLGPIMQYRGERPLDQIELLLFPGRDESILEFYEDDGISFKAFEDNEFTVTKITTIASSDGVVNITIGKPEGKFDGYPTSRVWKMVIALSSAPKCVSINAVPLEHSAFNWDDSRKEVIVPELNTNGDEMKIEISVD